MSERQVIIRATLASLLLIVSAGCAASRGEAPGQPEQITEEAYDLREEQMRLLYEYEAALREGETGCKTLCRHHTRICVLATRICEISERHKGNYKARAACKKATETCRETTTRLPKECWCGK